MVSAASLKIYVPIQEIHIYHGFILDFQKLVKCTVSSTFTLSEPTTSEPPTQIICEVVITKAFKNEKIAESLRNIISGQKPTWNTSDITLVTE